MDTYWMVLGLAFLPALGNFGGGLLADILYSYATIVNMKEKGVTKGRRMLLSA